MKRSNQASFFIILLIFSISCQSPNKSTPPQTEKAEVSKKAEVGEIDVRDEAFYDYVAKGASLEVLAEGYGWAEGPVWVEEQQLLLFSDVDKSIIYQWKEGETAKPYLQGDWKSSNGLTLNNDGRLVICMHGNRNVSLMDAPFESPANNFIELVSAYEGKKFSSPNDVDFDQAGNMYFTDPPYGLAGRDGDPAKEIPFNGVFKLSVSGELSLVTDTLSKPNGIAVSPDQKTLYVGQSDQEKATLSAFDLDENGKVSNGRILYNFTQYISKEMKGGVDGLRIHSSGTIFTTGPGGVWVLTPEGKVLGVIKTGVQTANCEIASDGYLYITAHRFLMRLKLA